jgi:hypothetical protein
MTTTTTTTTVTASAWLTDGAGELWVLVGPDPAGTGMAVYGLARRIANRQGHSPLRALAIEDAHGIDDRGPQVTLA